MIWYKQKCNRDSEKRASRGPLPALARTSHTCWKCGGFNEKSRLDRGGVRKDHSRQGHGTSKKKGIRLKKQQVQNFCTRGVSKQPSGQKVGLNGRLGDMV